MSTGLQIFSISSNFLKPYTLVKEENLLFWKKTNGYTLCGIYIFFAKVEKVKLICQH